MTPVTGMPKPERLERRFGRGFKMERNRGSCRSSAVMRCKHVVQLGVFGLGGMQTYLFSLPIAVIMLTMFSILLLFDQKQSRPASIQVSNENSILPM